MFLKIARTNLAQDDFEKGYSDIDLWIIIKECTSVKERIDITRKIVKLFDVAINEYLDSMHSDNQLKRYHYHGNWYFTEKEFVEYVKLYPTRVLYPIYFGVWKSIYGNDYIDQFELPQHKKLVEYLMLDFELFVREIESNLFCNNCRDLVKGHVKKCLPCNVKRCLLYHVKNSLPCGCKITLPRTVLH